MQFRLTTAAQDYLKLERLVINATDLADQLFAHKAYRGPLDIEIEGIMSAAASLRTSLIRLGNKPQWTEPER